MIRKFLARLFRFFNEKRCALGIHFVPRNQAFEHYGAVFAGGICTRCGKLKQGKFLGNVWTEETELKQEGRPSAIFLSGYDTAFAQKSGYAVKPLLQLIAEKESVK